MDYGALLKAFYYLALRVQEKLSLVSNKNDKQDYKKNIQFFDHIYKACSPSTSALQTCGIHFFLSMNYVRYYMSYFQSYFLRRSRGRGGRVCR